MFKKFLNLFKFLKKTKAPVLQKEEPVTVTPIAKEPGLLCPRCSSRIQVTIPMLLSGQPVYCTKCFLELTVDTQKSQEALNALQKLQSGLDQANEIMKQNRK